MKDNDLDYLAGVIDGLIIAGFVAEHYDEISAWVKRMARRAYDCFVQDVATEISEAMCGETLAEARAELLTTLRAQDPDSK